MRGAAMDNNDANKNAAGDTSATARRTISKMSPSKIKEINRLIRKAVDERDFPSFKAGLLKLGYDENSAEYEKLVRLWEDCLRASRRG